MGSCRSAPCARSVGWPAQRLSDLPAKIVPPLVAGDDVLARVDPRLGRLPPAALDGALLLLRLGRVLRREELVKVLRRLALPPELNRGAGLPGGLSLLELCDSVGLGRLSVREVQPARGSRGETPASSRGREREAPRAQREAPRARRGGSVRPERFVLQRKSLGALVLPRLSPRARSSPPRRLPRFTHEALDLLSADVLVVVLVVHRARRALLSSLSLSALGDRTGSTPRSLKKVSMRSSGTFLPMLSSCSLTASTLTLAIISPPSSSSSSLVLLRSLAHSSPSTSDR